MNIFHIVIGRPKPETSNGVLKSVYYLALYQGKQGHNVDVLSIRKKGEKESTVLADNARIHFFRKYSIPFLIDSNIKEYICNNKHKIDVVHIHSGYHPEYWRVSKLLTRWNIPFVISPRGSYQKIANNRSYFVKKIYKILFESSVIGKATRVHALNQQESLDIHEYGVAEDKISIIPNGVDVEKISEYMGVQCPEGKDKNKLTLIYCGRIDAYYKGLDVLVRAINDLVNVKNRREIHLSLIGPDWKGGMSVLKELIDRFNLRSHVKFHGARYGKEKYCLYSASDVFILPTRTEGMPTSVLEAMAYGMPCVVTPESNVDRKIAQNGGCLFVDLSPQEIVGMIEGILIDKDMLVDIGKKGQEWVQENYNYPSVANMHINQYKRCFSE